MYVLTITYGNIKINATELKKIKKAIKTLKTKLCFLCSCTLNYSYIYEYMIILLS